MASPHRVPDLLVRRLKYNDYSAGEVLSKAFVERRYPGLSLHEAVPLIVEDRALLYVTKSGYGGDPQGACLVPTAGEGCFKYSEDENDALFGNWHYDLVPAPTEETDVIATALAVRATKKAHEISRATGVKRGLLREAVKKGKIKSFWE